MSMRPTDQPTLPWDAAPQMTPEQQAATVIMIPRAHARRTDPYTSDQALKAIAKDESLMALIWDAAVHFEHYESAFNDTMLTERLEIVTGERHQRNVVARSRGLLTQAGLFKPVGVCDYGNRELMHYMIDRPAMVRAELERQMNLAQQKEKQ